MGSAHKILKYGLVVVGLVLVGMIFAQGEEFIPELIIELEVEAEKERPAKVDEVTTEKVEKMVNVQSVADAIERQPGVQAPRGCPIDSPHISIRAASYQWTQLLLDGVPVNPLGRPFLNWVPMTAIEKVEVIKGPAPPKYPGNTISGVVEMTTKTGNKYPGGKIATTFGSYNNQVYELTAGGGDEETNYFFAFNRHYSSGWRPHSLTNLWDTTTKLVFSPEDQSKLSLSGSYLAGEKEGFKPEGPNPFDKWEVRQSNISRPAAAIKYTRQVSPNSDILLRIAPFHFSCQTEWREWFTDHAEPRFLLQRYFLLRNEFQQNIRPTPNNVWTWGLWWQRDHFKFTDELETSYIGNIPADKWNDYSQTWHGILLQNTFMPSEESSITLGLRYDDAKPGGSATSPFFSWHRRLDELTALRFVVTRNRRFPNLHELYGEAMWIGNPNLKPEYAWIYQMDFEKIIKPGAILGLSIYRQNLRDIIAADPQHVYCNIGKGCVKGTELELRRELAKGTWWVNYSYLDAKDLTTNGPLITAFRTAPAKHTVKAGVSIKGKKNATYDIEVLWYGPKRTDVDKPTIINKPPWKGVVIPDEVSSYGLVNFKLTQPLGDKRALTFAIENLFDKDYQELLFFPAPGIWVNLSLSQKF